MPDAWNRQEIAIRILIIRLAEGVENRHGFLVGMQLSRARAPRTFVDRFEEGGAIRQAFVILDIEKHGDSASPASEQNRSFLSKGS